jgi:hypothetical protein
MKKVTEFREIPRNFTELYDTELGGILPELQPIPHGIRNRRKQKKQTEFHVGGIPWTPYYSAYLWGLPIALTSGNYLWGLPIALTSGDYL